MNAPRPNHQRCAIYVRKSHEDGLDQEYNSLDAQLESCEAYIKSQGGGWRAIDTHYADGGISGGTLDRPAMQALIEDIKAGLVDIVVVQKIDRLSRSLSDFTRLIDLFEAHDVTFVSVTQHFNTTDSMGRLTLNILSSFAQFEREITAERIREKIAGAKRRGMWTGGHTPLGYTVKDRKLILEPEEAATVRMIFERFVRVGSITDLARALAAEGVTNKRGKPIYKSGLYTLLQNPVYLGKVLLRGETFEGQHEAIIGQALWDKVQSIFQVSPRSRAARSRARVPALLKGLIFTEGRAMTPTHTRKGDKIYRYYIDSDLLRGGRAKHAASRIAAGEVEEAVVDRIRLLLRQPEIIVQTARELTRRGQSFDDSEIHKALCEFDNLWGALFPAEQARIIQLLVERVEVFDDGLEIRLRADGLSQLASELKPARSLEDA